MGKSLSYCVVTIYFKDGTIHEFESVDRRTVETDKRGCLKFRRIKHESKKSSKPWTTVTVRLKDVKYFETEENE